MIGRISCSAYWRDGECVGLYVRLYVSVFDRVHNSVSSDSQFSDASGNKIIESRVFDVDVCDPGGIDHFREVVRNYIELYGINKALPSYTTVRYVTTNSTTSTGNYYTWV